MTVDLRDLLTRPLPRTLLVPTDTPEFSKGATTPEVSWVRTFTGTMTTTVLVESADYLTPEELEAVSEGEDQIQRGEFATLADLEETLEA